MKLALYADHRPALIRGKHLIDICDLIGPEIMALRPDSRMRAVIAAIAAGKLSLNAASERVGVPIDEQTFCAPVDRPGKLLVALSNFDEGVQPCTSGLAIGLKSPSSVLASGGEVVLPLADAVVFHHEAQLAVVIGEPCKDIMPEQALNHVFGYTAAINIAARGLGFGMGINSDSFDTFTPLGPWVITREEVPDAHALGVTLRVDGALRERYSTGSAIHAVAEAVAYASHRACLEPGDVILLGACYQGVGPVQHGDKLSVEIDNIGSLTVTVSDPLRRHWPRGIDRSLATAAQEARRTGAPIPFKTASVQREGRGTPS